jgi:transposase InsO family protein
VSSSTVKKLGPIARVGHRINASRALQTKDRRGNRRSGALGWEFCHVCVDDATRLAYAEVLFDEKGSTDAGFLRRAAAWFASMGISIEAVMNDNGACYLSRAHADACAELGLRHLFTRLYRPQTNGKAERFIKTLIDRWTYGAICGTSAERTRVLPGWLTHYKLNRRHGSLGYRPPAARLRELEQRRE